ncbi:MAG: glycosyltransferase [Bacilli bacterium]
MKILFHLHGKGIYDVSKKEEKYYRYAFNNECVICLANSLCNDISKVYKGVPYVLNNGVEDNLKLEKEVICKSNDGKIRVLFLSNFLISKGIFDMLHIAKNISKTRSNVEFVMIGQYTKEVTEEHLRQKIKEAELSEFINLIGPLFTKEKFYIIKQCDIFLFPTHNEAFGNVLLETMQYYIPSIASNEGGIPDIVEDGVTGFLCEKKNISDFTEKLDKLISDDVLRVQMGRNARTRFEQRFTLDKFEQNLLTIIDEVV